ncbi:hypothetical protein PFICI_06742 [Pestalotiopsis fici W106-1]|uniref:WSC domain-containing protein n=1 Tax=Pestalotiopsis fici (strain W106-1 / CGMCC3.15140) TaxID=1229662 RepID=W3X6S2_PESFW|nr:uncharacterized protein PFICI_06742 [Pestalotiopsis fici W106-1]ETS81740.1 hypothetical protein PFICI_06742 [Pestalotiopsis fici W106-1]
MKINQAALAALAALPRLASASLAQRLKFLNTRDVEPGMPYDLNTISTCTWWYDNFEGLTCTDVRDLLYAISPEDFTRWNPSITLDCGNWKRLSYCVQVKSEQTQTTSTTSTTTTTSTASATAKPSLLGWESLGCYVDDDPHTLSTLSAKEGGSQLTVEKCQTACFGDDFLFAGVKAGTECWCGSYVSNEWASDQDDCNIPCGGQTSETCGGTSVMNIYEAEVKDTLPAPSTPTDTATTTTTSLATSTTTKATSTTSTSTTATAIPTWQALGCYKDLYPANDRTLKNLLATSDTSLTIASCQAMCKQDNYLYSGVENGRECWCGNEIQSSTTNVVVAETDCRTPCTGDSSEFCGAGARVYLYKYVAATEATWQTLGCYNDLYPTVNRTLRDLRDFSDTSITIAGCQTTCKKDGYLYAGVEDGRECWCGNEIQSSATNIPAATSDCNKACTGDSSELCGAGARVFLYKNIVPTAPWLGLGCYGEEDPRVLRNLLSVSYGRGNVTHQNCIDTCNRGGYSYAGVENGEECWCDDIINPPGDLASDGSAGCNKACTGNADETCGGLARLEIFVKSTSI